MLEILTRWYEENGFAANASAMAWWSGVGLLAASAVLLHFLLKWTLLWIIRPLAGRLHFKTPAAVLRGSLPVWMVHLLTAAYLYNAAPGFLGPESTGAHAVRSLSLLYQLFAGMMACFSLLDGLVKLYEKRPLAREVPATSFVQVFKLLIALVTLIFAISVLVDRSPLIIFSGLGAMTAVLLLVFKDAILGFVAGIQLAANRMVAVGDWIEMPKYGADGEVEEVALTTVKVRNWDMTRTTIPTYALISDSFKNWRGMEESGGRRIKRPLHIDMQSVKLMDPALHARLAEIRLLKDYLAAKDRELEEWHAKQGTVSPDDINRRHLTNIGTFRAYVEVYLRRHPKIHQDMTLLVRQLLPDEKGLPLEIYCFTNDIRWAAYESIVADIFDHLLAVAREFDLRIYQHPSGGDLRDFLNTPRRNV